MACTIKLTRIEEDDKKFVQDTLSLANPKDDRDFYECFDVNGEFLHMPFWFGYDTFRVPRPEATVSAAKAMFTGELRPEQISVAEKSTKMFEEKGSIIISACPGFGKTVTAIKLACDLGYPTAIVVNKIVLVNQWREAISKFTSGSSQYVTATTKTLDPTVQFYVINAINIRKKSREFWSPVKFLIVDELHQIITKVLSQNLLKFDPRAVLGLSATPFRYDELDKAISWFFGPSIIGKGLWHPHTVFCTNTGFKPTIQTTPQGRLDWGAVLKSQCENDARNDIIVKNVLAFPDRTWMILIKRVEHATLLMEKFSKLDVKCTTLLGSQVTYDKTCKILIGTTSKIGVGFDKADIDALCIAGDVENYFVQFLGRCTRDKNIHPYVLDFCDDNGTLKDHLETRIGVYKAHGGKIKTMPN